MTSRQHHHRVLLSRRPYRTERMTKFCLHHSDCIFKSQQAILLAYVSLVICLTIETENAVPLRSDRWCYTDATFFWAHELEKDKLVNL